MPRAAPAVLVGTLIFASLAGVAAGSPGAGETAGQPPAARVAAASDPVPGSRGAPGDAGANSGASNNAGTGQTNGGATGPGLGSGRGSADGTGQGSVSGTGNAPAPNAVTVNGTGRAQNAVTATGNAQTVNASRGGGSTQAQGAANGNGRGSPGGTGAAATATGNACGRCVANQTATVATPAAAPASFVPVTAHTPAASVKSPAPSVSRGRTQTHRPASGRSRPGASTHARPRATSPQHGTAAATGSGVNAVARPAAASLQAVLAASVPHTARRGVAHARGVKPEVGHPRTPPASAGTVILQFVRTIPTALWWILGGSLALAAIGAASALRSARQARRQRRALAAISAAALTDPLTGVLNRRGFLEAAERELARAQRYGRPFALAYVDIRGLKMVNDSQGHLAGDELLRQAAVLLKESARADDVVGRLGGDELAVLLVEQTSEGAEVVTRRIRDELPGRRAAMDFAAPWDLTIGTASFPEDGDELEELLRTADERLYAQRGITLL